MSALFEILRFELRLQWRSPLFIALLGFVALLHFLAARKIGLDIGLGAAADLVAVDLNAAVAILHNELVLSLLLVFPAVALAATAITRDVEWRTAEQFYGLPIRPGAYAAGRFGGALVMILLLAGLGVLVALVSLLLPGADPARMGSFAIAPWLYALGIIIVPNTVIATGLVFAAAAAWRSLSAGFAVALALPLVPLIGQSWMGEGSSPWLALMDPFGALSIAQVTRYWDGRELVEQLPAGLLLINRALWLAITAAVLALTFTRFRFVLPERGVRSARAATRADEAARTPTLSTAPSSVVLPSAQRLARAAPVFDALAVLRQLRSQIHMDLRAIMKGWTFALLLILVVVACAQYFFAPDPLGLRMPPLPRTTRLTGFLDVGLAFQLTLGLAWFAGLLVHRERQSRLAGIVDASPMPIGVPVLGKCMALFLAVTLLLLAGIATFVTLQLLRGDVPVQPLLWLQGLLVFGFNHYALIVPAVLIHLLVGNRWLGTLLFLAAAFATIMLPAFGIENLLVSFRQATVPHSDMNGFGHFVARTAAQLTYWTGVLLLLAVGACLLAPRGERPGLAARLSQAATRWTLTARAATAAGVLVAGTAAAYIVWNIYFLNDYVTGHIDQQRAAEYERRYRPLATLPMPELAAIDIAVDFQPGQRRVDMRGTLQLFNHTPRSIDELLVAVNPLLDVDELAVDGAEVIAHDAPLNVWRWRLREPLDPGARTALRWSSSWHNEGFTNLPLGNAVAANGTLFYGSDILPVVGYDGEREIESVAVRQRHGLPPVLALPDLDDPAARAALNPSFPEVDFHAVLSTSADQVPVTVGRRLREWTQADRRYAEYGGRLLPALGFASARYDITRTQLGDVDVEVYHDPQHARAVPTLIETLRRGFDYYGREFGPYQLDYFRIAEYPRYSTRVRALAGMVAFAERSGFDADFPPGTTDMVVAHELAHMWWGGQIRSARVQGQQVLNEGLASYAAMMLIEATQGREAVRQPQRDLRHQYLDSVSRTGEIELPVVRAQFGSTAYGKAALSMYALSHAAGSEPVHRGLRNFIVNHGNRPVPFPTTRELVAELRAATGPDFDALITDLFERAAYQEFAVRGGALRAGASGQQVTLDLELRQYVAEAGGSEREVPLTLPLEIEFTGADPDQKLLVRRQLPSGSQQITVDLPWKPVSVTLDPYALALDRYPEDDSLAF